MHNTGPILIAYDGSPGTATLDAAAGADRARAAGC